MIALGMPVTTVSLGVLAQAAGDAESSTVIDADTETTPDASDAGVEALDGGAESTAPEASAARPAVLDTEQPEERPAPPKDRRAWRRDPSVLRHPGSYLGGGMGYLMSFSWFTNEQRDFSTDYEIGPVHGTNMNLRAGDAFFEWLAVGFQVTINNGAIDQSADEKTSGFGLYLDTTLYPWRGFGIRPSVGLGFGYSQAGTESYKLGFGGPLSLSISMSYEARITRLFTIGPMVQLSWIRGDEYDVLYLTIGIEFLKWFQTAEG